MAGYIGSAASVVSSGAENKKTFTITGATTSLTGLNYPVGKVHVFQNGVRLVDGTDYTATNGTTITLTVAAQSGDNVVVTSQAAFQVSGAVSTSGGTMTGALTTTGLTVGGTGIISNGDILIEDNTPFINISNTGENLGGIKMYDSAGASTQYFNLTYDSGASNTVGFDTGASGEYTFSVNTAEKMRLESSGNLLLRSTDSANITGHSSPYLEFRAGQTNGQNVTLGKIKGSSPGGWGGDIIFETKAANGQVNDTTAERLRIRENGGITFNGDTANANTLNDYEEGSYNTTFATDTSATVPNFAGTTYYIKIGKMVHIHGQIAVSGSSSGGINLHVPLPFTPVGMRGALAVGLNQALSMKSAGEYLTIIVETNSPKAYIVSTAFGGGHSHLGFDQCGSGLFTFAGSYRTT
jgi:hypothetical protein